MKDALGRELKVGDTVANVYSVRNKIMVREATVDSFTEKMVRVKMGEGYYQHITAKKPSMLVKIFGE